jgi:hypothetical protein
LSFLKRSPFYYIGDVDLRLTDREWHTPQRFLKTFSPLAASPEAFFFFGVIFILFQKATIGLIRECSVFLSLTVKQLTFSTLVILAYACYSTLNSMPVDKDGGVFSHFLQ